MSRNFSVVHYAKKQNIIYPLHSLVLKKSIEKKKPKTEWPIIEKLKCEQLKPKFSPPYLIYLIKSCVKESNTYYYSLVFHIH